MHMVKKTASIVIVLAIMLTILMGEVKVFATETSNLTEEQNNALEMLNYITVLTQEINASKNSRVYMEEAYSSLINNTYPNAVDNRTLSQMTGLLDTMENYRMIDVKRERLEYVYEQSQAEAIRSAVPNPMGMISAVNSFSPAKLVTSIAYMAVDSVTSYNAYSSESEKEFLQEGWALDDEEAKVLHESRKGTFSYLVRMVNDNDLPGERTLTEDTVKELVEWKNNTNIVGRIQFLESNQNTYQYYGGYWLILAESYYQNAEYSKCLDALTKYENMGTKIFRRDYEYAKTLPLGIAAAKDTMSISTYAPYAAKRAQLIIDNTDHNDWSLRYFAAQTLVDLYAETKDLTYLDNAYKITLDNVNYLIAEQKSQNTIYLESIKEKQIPKDANKVEKSEIKEYNKMIEKNRKTEIPPIFEPLVLNCELLFALADEMKISVEEKNKIDKMLHSNGETLFLISPIEDRFVFTPITNPNKLNIMCSFNGSRMILPTAYLSKSAKIKVSVYNSDGSNAGEFVDWNIEEVKREKEGDIYTYSTEFSSETCDDFDFKPNQKIIINVLCDEGANVSYQFNFHTEGTKNEWYDYGKVWEKSVKIVPGN